MDEVSVLDRAIEERRGILKLRPTYVTRYYPHGNRLGQQNLAVSGRGRFVPERWIASTVDAVNPLPVANEGLSFLDLPEGDLTLKDALRLRGEYLLGETRNEAHGGDFLVLTKILDPGAPILFHLHASDEKVRAFPENFRGHRFGKDEAYYFLDAPKGPVPYTHFGLFDGATQEELVARIERFDGSILEMSPCYLQTVGEGFMTPAGIPHRPGTALTLEVQQPSDVYTRLEKGRDGQPMNVEERHPGFDTLEEALERVLDLDRARNPRLFDENRLVPRPDDGIERESAEQDWIFPPEATPKFSGKRLSVGRAAEGVEESCFALLVWRGVGKLNGLEIFGGDEFFVSHQVARASLVFENSGTEPLVVFKIFPPDPARWRP